jgi:Undecaprenyl-phosphate glucose phosphotransferase
MTDLVDPGSIPFVARPAVRGATERPRFVHRLRIQLSVQFIDVVAIFAIALLLYPVSGGSLTALPMRYVLGALAAALICHASFSQGHLYEIDALLNETRSIKSILVRWSVVFLGLAAMTALVRQPQLYSRIWFVGFYLCGGVVLAGQRSMVALAMRQWIRRGYMTRSVVIVGVNALAAGLIERLENNRSGIRVVGVFDDQPDVSETAVRGVPMLGSVDDLLEFSKAHTTDLVVLTLPIAATERLNAVVAKLRHQPLAIRVLPGEIGLDRISPIRLSRDELPGVQLIAIADRPISEFALFVKGAIDRAAAAFGLLLLAPLFLFIACGIAMTSSGPVFFRQARVGYRGHVFHIFKFRTMHHEFCGSYAPTYRGDSRIFPFGQILRKLSLDELPQLINVLIGDMSLVGPRPHMLGQTVDGKTFFEAVNEYAGRHRVKPGITGWAQVNGWRGPTETLEQIERRVEHDIYYIENWSLMLDLVILLKTLFVGFFGRNAF